MAVAITTTSPLPGAASGVAYSHGFTESSNGMRPNVVWSVDYADAALGSVAFSGGSLQFTPISGTVPGSPALVTVRLRDTDDPLEPDDVEDFDVAVSGAVVSSGGGGSSGAAAAAIMSIRRRLRRRRSFGAGFRGSVVE